MTLLAPALRVGVRPELPEELSTWGFSISSFPESPETGVADAALGVSSLSEGAAFLAWSGESSEGQDMSSARAGLAINELHRRIVETIEVIRVFIYLLERVYLRSPGNPPDWLAYLIPHYAKEI